MGVESMSEAAAVPTASADGMRWTLSPFFLVRVGGLAEEDVAPLRSPLLADWAGRVLDLEGDLDALAGPVCDALADAVGGTDDPARRRALLKIRRDVHNRRLPGAAMPPSTPDGVARWVALRRDYQDALDEGGGLLDAALEHCRARLRQVAGGETLRRGLQVGSPVLERELDRYLSAAGNGGKKARKVERSLLAYILRTAYKTSPFSSLTTVALGRFDAAADGGAPGAVHHDNGDGTRGTARFNLAAFPPLAAAIEGAPALRRDLPVELSAGCRTEERRVRYVRRTYQPPENRWQTVAGYLDENVFTLPRTPLLDEVVAEAVAHGPLPLSDLAARIHAADPAARPADQVEEYLGRLLVLGLLTAPVLRVDPHHGDPFADLAARIAALDAPWTAEFAGHLDRIAERAAALPAAATGDRRAILAGVRSGVDDAARHIGLADPDPPNALVYEDVAHTGGPRAAPGAWEDALMPDLCALAGIMPLFDDLLPERLATRTYLRHRRGPGGTHDDVVRFAHEFNEDYLHLFLATGGGAAALAEDSGGGDRFRPPEFDALRAARAELSARVQAAYDRLPPGAPELALDGDTLADVASLLPPHLVERTSVSLFLQHAPSAGGHVLNTAHTGWGGQIARFAHDFAPEEAEELRAGMAAHLASMAPEGTVFASLSNGYDASNLSLYPALTPYELVCPGDVGFREPDAQIPVGDLRIVDDEASGRLRLVSRRLGATVVPVYSGALIPKSLSRVKRVLLAFSDTCMGTPDLWSGVRGERPAGDMAHRPRLRHGGVVLHRARWRTGADGLPHRADSADDVDFHLRWRRMAANAGLPRRMFVRQENAGATHAARKPRYIDLDNPLSLAAADDALTPGRTQVLTEMLPDTGDMGWTSHAGRHVSETVVEINGTRTTEGSPQ
ncbi:lantibiotic biosynthesis dehydratase-like protein [Murinocardiopsis flavida]|uniref:Lantibiotic biosynthesis dehydratase-like protein n=1 Tax=Murinocardiopsis flavida TaxID=645275 RepID=A0A2P8DRS5_9ACTN|nr:lantibiotic biosynthesis dehydratase-like protein [Murinocardiopsis flavida]